MSQQDVGVLNFTEAERKEYGIFVSRFGVMGAAMFALLQKKRGKINELRGKLEGFMYVDREVSAYNKALNDVLQVLTEYED